jgi:hypothetical protein
MDKKYIQNAPMSLCCCHFDLKAKSYLGLHKYPGCVPLLRIVPYAPYTLRCKRLFFMQYGRRAHAVGHEGWLKGAPEHHYGP